MTPHSTSRHTTHTFHSRTTSHAAPRPEARGPEAHEEDAKKAANLAPRPEVADALEPKGAKCPIAPEPEEHETAELAHPTPRPATSTPRDDRAECRHEPTARLPPRSEQSLASPRHAETRRARNCPQDGHTHSMPTAPTSRLPNSRPEPADADEAHEPSKMAQDGSAAQAPEHSEHEEGELGP